MTFKLPVKFFYFYDYLTRPNMLQNWLNFFSPTNDFVNML